MQLLLLQFDECDMAIVNLLHMLQQLSYHCKIMLHDALLPQLMLLLLLLNYYYSFQYLTMLRLLKMTNDVVNVFDKVNIVMNDDEM